MTRPVRVDADGFRVYEQDPGAVLPYAFDFATFPGAPYLRTGETLAAAVWSVDGPDAALLIGDGATPVVRESGTVTPGAPAFTGTQAQVTLYGGTVGAIYTVTCKFRTEGVTPIQVDERSFRVEIADK